MNRNFIFVFILLAALSIVHAIPHKLLKRETAFGQCDYPNPPPQLTVTLSPDPVVSENPNTFTISGQLNEDMPADAEIFAYFYDPKNNNNLVGDVNSKPVCENECPKAGTPFTVTLDISKVPKLPDQYGITVDIFSFPSILACSNAVVGS